MQEREDLTKQIRLEDMKVIAESTANAALCAYVTFETEEGVVASLLTYSSSWFKYIFMPKHKRFKGSRITVRMALHHLFQRS
jgi:hypothetical protein